MIYDAIIIGGGAAGLTAGLYLSRAKLKTLVLEKGVTGGLTATTHSIENYPGFPDGIDGMKLMDLFRKQAENFNCEIKEIKEVIRVDFSEKVRKIFTKNQEFHARGIILATGSVPKKLEIPNEKKLTSRGVSYCATCDGAFFREKKVFVVGGGDSAFKEAIFLSRFAKEITIIHRSDKYRADKINIERVENNPKITIRPFTEILSFEGGMKLEKVELLDNQKNKKYSEKIDGVFIYIGQVPNTDFLENIINLDDQKRIKTDIHMKTNIYGIYACGDVRSFSKRQTSISVGDAATASINLEEYLSEN